MTSERWEGIIPIWRERERAAPDLAVGAEDGSIIGFKRETLSW